MVEVSAAVKYFHLAATFN